MVPQPERVLAFHADEVQKGAKYVLAMAFLSGVGFAWWFAGRLTAPIAAVEAASNRLAAGDLGVRVGDKYFMEPSEVASLAENFNAMATRIKSREQERDRAEKELLKSKAEVEYANRAKTEFLAHMSHELRTPLNAINGFAEILQTIPLDAMDAAQVSRYAHCIRESGGHLLKLINDLLDISRIEAGALALDYGDVDIKDIVSCCLPIVSDRATRGGLRLNFDVAPGLPMIEADATRLRQIILNLRINAIKFTPEGGQIDLKVRPAYDDGIEIVVTDTGTGIPPEDLSRVLEPFGRSRQSHTTRARARASDCRWRSVSRACTAGI
ncbi:MAG: HAMP domain-containing sensor histidine kinase [Rhodospirillaceae bacterium]